MLQRISNLAFGLERRCWRYRTKIVQDCTVTYLESRPGLRRIARGLFVLGMATDPVNRRTAAAPHEDPNDAFLDEWSRA
jgi:hypothetical protein